jgi:hypothetical protein
VVCATGPCAVRCEDESGACRDAVVFCGTNACETTCLGDSRSPHTSCGLACSCTACED